MLSSRMTTSVVLAALASHLWLAGPARAADYAPLNCAKAASASEKAICSNYGLGQDEARMATLYALTTSLVAMGQRGNIQDDQRSFLKNRDACGSKIPCLRDAYGTRIRQLDAIMSRIAERGPF